MTSSISGNCASCGHEIRPGTAFCPGCGKPAAGPSIPQESPAAQGAAKAPGGKPLWFIILTVCVCVVFGYLFFTYLPGGEHPVIAEQPAVEGVATGGHVDMVTVAATVEGGNVTIPLAEVIAKRIVAFEYSDGTVTVPLLAFVTGEGRVVTSYRMCEPCNSKTYAIDGDRLSCGNCETQWSLNTLEGLQGNCQKYPPEPFPSVVEGGRVVMSIARIKEWKIRL
jgi:ribosomal protein S27AE